MPVETYAHTHTHTPTRKYVIKERRALLAHPAPTNRSVKRHIVRETCNRPEPSTFLPSHLYASKKGAGIDNYARHRAGTHREHSNPRHPPPITNFQRQNPSSTRVPLAEQSAPVTDSACAALLFLIKGASCSSMKKSRELTRLLRFHHHSFIYFDFFCKKIVANGSVDDVAGGNETLLNAG
jgi:hypothetical protein